MTHPEERAQALSWKLLTAKAVICAVSEQVFEPRLANTEPHSAGLPEDLLEPGR